MTTNTEKAIAADPSKGVKVNAAVIAQPFRDEIKERVQQLKNHGIGTFTPLFTAAASMPEFQDENGKGFLIHAHYSPIPLVLL